MRRVVLIAGVAALSWGHAVTTAGAGAPGLAASDAYVAGLGAAAAWANGDAAALGAAVVAAPGTGLVAAWMGAWLLLFGKSYTVAVASFLPFHALAAAGLWRGGRALGGADADGAWRGGAWALLAGLGSVGALAGAAEPRPAFAAFACFVYAVAAALEQRRVAMFVALFVAGALAWPGADAALDLAGLATLAGQAIGVAVVAALLTRGDVVTLGVLAGAVLLGAASLLGADTGVAAVGVLALVGAGAAASWVYGGVVALAVAQIVGFHLTLDTWPGRPAPLRLAPLDPADDALIDEALVWLDAHRADGPATVATYLAHDRLHRGRFAARAAEQGRPLRFVDALTADTSDLGLVVRPRAGPTAHDGWRAQLPPIALSTGAPGATMLELWDRGLPPQTLLATPEIAETRNHPAHQALWAYGPDGEVGPLLTDASSAVVVRTDAGLEALFVRDQALWRASSPTGADFGPARPLTDAAGAPIAAFDPDVVTLPDGTLRVYAAELTGADRAVDPALHPTEIRSWRGPTLDALVREPGARLAGVGLVDPSVRREADGTWTLFVTEDRRRVSAATSPDGLTFGALAAVAEGTVPAQSPFGLLVQRQVMGWSVVYAIDEEGAGVSLELCATGASFADRLYYTRADQPCPAIIASPERRRLTLNARLRALGVSE